MYLNEILPGNWREDEWPEHIEVSHESSRFMSRRYVPRVNSVNKSSANPVDGIWCSHCGWAGVIAQDMTDLDEMTEPQFDILAEDEESVQIASLDGNSYISGHIGGHSFMGTGGVSGEINEDDYYTLMVSDGDGGYGKRRYKVDEVKLIFDSTEEDARVEEVDVVRNYDVTRSPFFAFDMKGECREVEHQTRIHVPEGSWGEYQFNVN